MKRREAIKGIFIFSLGTSILYSCKNPFEAVRSLNLSKIDLDDKHLDLIDRISKLIVPIHQIPELAHHTTLPFLLKQINDLYSDSDIHDFIDMSKNFDNHYKSDHETSFLKHTETDQLDFLRKLNQYGSLIHKPSTVEDHLAQFITTIKKENLIYFKTSEYYQRNFKFYEMAPGRFIGNLPLDSLTVHPE